MNCALSMRVLLACQIPCCGLMHCLAVDSPQHTAVLPPPIALAAPAATADWPHWRGLDRNDSTTESSGWDGQRWLKDSPSWEANVGLGSTSPLVADGHVYVMGWENGQDRVRCLDARKGRPIWMGSYPCPKHGRYASGDESLYGGVTSTPEWDPTTHLLYTLSCDGDLICWDTDAAGKKAWGFNLYDHFHVKQRPATNVPGSEVRDYGYTTSPFVYGDWLIVEVGANDGCVMAFDKRTGDRRWVSQYRGPAGHTGGLTPITVDSVSCAAILTLRALVVVRMDAGHEGQTAAQYPWESAWGDNILTPTAVGDSVLIGSWHTHRSLCRLRITLHGATRVWDAPDISHVGSPVVQGGFVYIAAGRLSCLDWATGKRVWAGGSYDNGGAVIATGDGKLVVWSDTGRAALVKSARESPAAYTELTRTPRLFGDGSMAWPHPVLADGLMFVKNMAGTLRCFAHAR